MRKRHETHEEERRHAAAAAAPAPAAGVLALQQSAGNHAVTAMLARQTAPAAPAKDKFVEIEGIGTVPITSAAGVTNQRGPGSGGGEPDPKAPTEVRFTGLTGEHSVKLMQALAAGTTWKSAEVNTAGLRFRLAGVTITGYSSANDAGAAQVDEQWSVLADQIELR